MGDFGFRISDLGEGGMVVELVGLDALTRGGWPWTGSRGPGGSVPRKRGWCPAWGEAVWRGLGSPPLKGRACDGAEGEKSEEVGMCGD